MDYSEYHSSDEIDSALAELENQYPDISRRVILGYSQGNRPIWGLKISDNPAVDENEPILYIDAGIHGNEWIGVEVAFFTATYLLENYTSDPKVQNIINQLEIWIVPMLNPDGHHLLEVQAIPEILSIQEIGRKNSFDVFNFMAGTDLNRNFDTRWGDTSDGSSHVPISINYCGERAFSEPETQAIRNLLIRRPPSASIHYHSYGQYIAYPGEDDPDSIYLAQEMANRIHAVNGEAYDVQHTYKSGGEKEWIYDIFSCPSFVVELRPSGTPPGYMLPQSQIEETAEENLAGSLFLMEWIEGHHPL